MNTSIADLNTRDQILITGEDSARFLQGQLTCDISHLSTSIFSYGAVCNTKGRVMTNFLISQIDENGSSFLMEAEQGTGSLLASHLSKYAVFYKAEIAAANDQYHRWGIISPEPGKLLAPLGLNVPDKAGSQQISGNYLVLRLPDSINGLLRLELIILPDTKQPTLDLLAGLSIDQWRIEELKAGYPLLAASVTEKFTPQELNLDLTGAVSFTKGCYTGQEIVARMHYRGKAKKRMYFFSTIKGADLDKVNADSWQLTEKTGSDTKTDAFNFIKSDGEICGLAVLKDTEAGEKFVIKHESGLEVPVKIQSLR